MTVNLINRQRELRFLDSKFKTGRPEFIVLWGRRRVGKTFLLKEFCRRHPGIFYIALTSSMKEQLEQISSAVADFFSDEFIRMRQFQNWDEVSLYLKGKRGKPFSFIIDEFPYLINSDRSIPSIFQRGWEEHLNKNPDVMLILNGSSISMMENEVLGAKSPLYGRRTGQWKVAPLTINDLGELFQKKTKAELIEIYCVVGGIPFYWTLFDKRLGLFGNIKSKILKKGEVLYEEVAFLLKEEFKEPRTYFPILSAIAAGNHKFGNISSKTGMDKSNLTKYLSVLADLQIIRRETPVTEKFPHKSKKGLYFINDPFINFWFHFVRPNFRHLEMDKTDYVLNEKIKPEFDYYVSRYCEPVIYEFMEEINCRGKFPFTISVMGRYWDKDIEVDMLAFDEKRKKCIVGEIKWRKKAVGMEVLHSLKEKAAKIEALKGMNIYFMIVSKSGFTVDLNEKEEVILIDLGTRASGE